MEGRVESVGELDWIVLRRCDGKGKKGEGGREGAGELHGLRRQSNAGKKPKQHHRQPNHRPYSQHVRRTLHAHEPSLAASTGASATAPPGGAGGGGVLTAVLVLKARGRLRRRGRAGAGCVAAVQVWRVRRTKCRAAEDDADMVGAVVLCCGPGGG
jgi:hypothetical protein